MISEAKEFVEETYSLIKGLIKDAYKLSNKELSQLYSKFSYHHANYYTRMWMVFRICERIILKIETILKEKIKDDRKIKEFSRILSTPLKPNDVTNERIGLLKIAIRKRWFVSKDIKKHTEKYRHIPMFDFDHNPYNYEHFLKELKLIKNPIKELKRIKESFKQRKENFDLALEKIKPNAKLNNLIIMLKKAIILRDYRDMIRQKLNLAIKEIYNTIDSRIGLDVKEIALLTNKEIERKLINSTNFSKKEIENRKKSFLLFQSNNRIKIYSEYDAKRRADKFNLYNNIKKINIIKGITASSGCTKGIAKIVHTNLDLNKVKKGDILVAGMTRQDFVPAMRKASAIVTNEGGVTCHAAIIARELDIPCIVGVKNATDIIKDGDIISVNGAKGIIEIIKRNKI